MTDNELDRERARVARLYARLDALRADEAHRLATVRSQKVGGNHQMRSERDALARMHEDRLLQLREVDARLVFGRLQLPHLPTEDAEAGFRYIGRMGLRDEEQRSLLLDWRAPQASAFYQATAARPHGVLARRHVTMREREVIRLDDEVFDADLLAEAGAEHNVQGEGALMAALTVHRTGRMHDIVATIQAEQDRIIRSDMRGALVVQGGPGTGKTAVALHRAAYLLYTHRERLGSAGVLIVGPSGAFLRYIETVLPSLGETGVVLQSLGELYPGVIATDDDVAEVALLKGSTQLADLIARAVKSRQRVPEQPQRIEVNGDVLIVEPALIARAIARAQQSTKPHNEARVTFVNHALDALVNQLATQLRAGGYPVDDTDLGLLREDIRASHDARVVLNTAWLPMTGEKLIQDLYARPEWLASLTPRWTPLKRALLLRSRDEPFTVSDIPLLDEAAELLGSPPAAPEAGQRERDLQRAHDIENAEDAIRNAGVEGMVSAEQLADNFAETTVRATTAERAGADRTWTYGHVVVDEAQELSPMQWRVLVRRSPMRSFTIVGDIAQASSAGASRSWRSALDPFFRGRWDLEELTVNYRTPAQIAREAERIATEHGLPITPTQSVREGDWPIRNLTVDVSVNVSDDLSDEGADAVAVVVGATVAAAVEDAVRHDRGIDASGTLAVIVPRAARDSILAHLVGAFGNEVGAGERGLERPIAVLTAHESKGLEFDSVILADPDALVAESPRGHAALYVAMTRPTQRLTMVRVAEPQG